MTEQSATSVWCAQHKMEVRYADGSLVHVRHGDACESMEFTIRREQPATWAQALSLTRLADRTSR